MYRLLWILVMFCLESLPIIGFAQISYSESAETLNVDFSYEQQTIGGGVCVYDFNHDGLDDLTLAAEGGRPHEFYLNLGDQFEKIPSLIPEMDQAKQLLWLDFDNDGDSDLYVAAFDGINRLYKNTGNLNMVDITSESGLFMGIRRSYGACAGDYNRDGWLDIYVSSRQVPGLDTINENRLFRNNADGTFTDATESSGAGDFGKTPFCSAFIDFNNDKWPDIYIANDRGSGNTLLQNMSDGTFTDVSIMTGTNLVMNAMSVSPGDINNDSWVDIYVSNTEEGNALLLNNGPKQSGEHTFTEVAESLGAGFHGIAWGTQFLDADNDGDLDLYVSGMLVGSDVISSACYAYENEFFIQDVNGMEGDTVSSFSNAVGDFNADGYLDIVVQNNSPFKFQLWQNTTANDNHWVKFDLKGILSNRDAIGTSIVCYSGNLVQYKSTYCGQGFLGQNSRQLHFGLQAHALIDSVKVTWPTGHVDIFYDLPVDQVHSITEGQSTGGLIHVDPDVSIISGTEPHNSIKSLSQIIAYPNPVSDLLNLSGLPEDGSPAHVSILSSLGHHALKPSGNHAHQFSISTLEPGVYFVVVRQPSSLQTVRVVKR